MSDSFDDPNPEERICENCGKRFSVQIERKCPRCMSYFVRKIRHRDNVREVFQIGQHPTELFDPSKA
jgi:predicted Zn-ribbon and HTH transcriptional regulator